MPKYEVTYIIENDAADVVDLQTPEQPGWSTPLRIAVETGEGVKSVSVRRILED